jgi:hypothetical protein
MARGNKRARLSEPSEPEASSSNSALVPTATPAPVRRLSIHISKSEDNKWGHTPRPSREGCTEECCFGLVFGWTCTGLATYAILPAFL